MLSYFNLYIKDNNLYNNVIILIKIVDEIGILDAR